MKLERLLALVCLASVAGGVRSILIGDYENLLMAYMGIGFFTVAGVLLGVPSKYLYKIPGLKRFDEWRPGVLRKILKGKKNKIS